MKIQSDNFYLDCYLSLLEKDYAPQFKGEHILFNYNSLQIVISKINDKYGNYMFAVYDVTNTKKKNKAVIHRFFQDTHYETKHPVRMRIEKDETVTIYLVTYSLTPLSELNEHLDYFCEVLAESYDVFIEMVIRRYGEE